MLSGPPRSPAPSPALKYPLAEQCLFHCSEYKNVLKTVGMKGIPRFMRLDETSPQFCWG